MKTRKCYWWLGLVSWLGLGVCECLQQSFAEPALAQQQVIADPTLGTAVTGNGTTFEITGGTTVGERNLFHSFSRFDVPVGGSADFLNNPAIVNIFSRVTGGTPSDIQGLVRTRGNANLFLMNPSGIVFGRDAQLDIGGSFVATTANAIAFPGGEFSLNSSVSPENTLLSVNSSAFLFNQISAQSITNQSTTGLQVRDGKSLLLVGGDIRLDGGVLFAPGGRVELGGVAGSGIVGLNVDENLHLSFPDRLARADIFLTNNGAVNTSGEGGGDIQVYGNNVTLANRSFIFSDTLGSQNGKGVFIRASKLDMSGGSNISASTVNSGNAGNVQIQASDAVAITDLNSSISSVVTESAMGSGGNITIEARRLTTRNGGQVLTNTNTLGDKPGGNITVTALGCKRRSY
ncbi:filamentous hemagglutinin N-terminal domain-containing protein [Scytonema sp. NUACC26]|uniref:filamentous hemagglutinin N-terminal domain-containing protein n=1 Tax=Scytonema sp. NUACC26 TaxID=3140176 RepID=UPI0034DC31C8